MWIFGVEMECSGIPCFGMPNSFSMPNCLQSVLLCLNSVDRNHLVCRFLGTFGRPKGPNQGISVDRLNFDLPFSRQVRTIEPFRSTELGDFGRPIGFQSANFGLECFPGLFSYGFN